MGYTHYFSHFGCSAAEFAKIADATRKIIKASGVGIAGGNGLGIPEVTRHNVALNGCRPDLDHETFCLNRIGGTDFCKTARKPYDIVVTACLAYVAAYHDYEISSDGDVEDWIAGTELANKALGVPVPNPIIVNQLKGKAA